jgi:pentapeptide MXKDX repeat protein
MVKNIKEVKAAMKKRAKMSKQVMAKKVVANVKSNSQYIDKTEKTANRLYGIFETSSKTFGESELKAVSASLTKMNECVNKRYAKAINDLKIAIALNLPNSKLISQIEDLTGLHSKLAMLKVQADASLAEDNEILAIDSTGFVIDTAEEQASGEMVAEEIDATEDIAVEDTASEETVAEDAVAEDAVAEDAVAEDAVAEETVAEDAVAEETVAEDAVAEDTLAEDTLAEDTLAEDTLAEDTEEEDVGEGSVEGQDEVLIEDEEEVEDLNELTEENEEDSLIDEEDIGEGTDIEDIELEDENIDEFVTNEILNEDEMGVLEEEPENEEEEVTSSIKAKKLKTAKKIKNGAETAEDGMIAQLFEDFV